MLLDSGTLRICRLENNADAGNMPKDRLIQLRTHYYGERTVGYGRQYAAKGVNEQVDMVARIWQDRAVRIGMYVVTDDGNQYRVDNVQQLFDEDGLRVTDLTLSQLEALHDVSGEV